MKRQTSNTKRKKTGRASLPESTAWLFPEYDFARMNVEDYANVIIERILERGTWEDINWLFAQYGEKGVQSWLRRWGYRALTRRSFALWQLVLNIKRFHAPPWARAKMGPW